MILFIKAQDYVQGDTQRINCLIKSGDRTPDLTAVSKERFYKFPRIINNLLVPYFIFVVKRVLDIILLC